MQYFTQDKYPTNSVLQIIKIKMKFAMRHHFPLVGTRIRSLALHQHELMEVIP